MPIYRFRCSDCHNEMEQILPMHERDNRYSCECGGILERLMSTCSFKIAQTSKGLVTDTLNREYKTLPPEQVAIMAPGLKELDRPVIGRGF